ncbi:MAG: transposase, partial [Candidatus Thiodiazotropha sp.]
MPHAAITERSPHSPPYKHHRQEEQTLLYHIIEQHYPAFRDVMAAQGKDLPPHVQQEFADCLKCGRLEHGFLRVQCTECHEEDDWFVQVAKVAGFSLHAGVAAEVWERQKLERFCRYISKPAVAEKRLSLTPSGNIRYQLKTPYHDGTTHIMFEPLDFMSHIHVL